MKDAEFSEDVQETHASKTWSSPCALRATAAEQVHETVVCPAGLMGQIDGVGYESITALEQRSHCRITIDARLEPCKIAVCGRIEQVDLAVGILMARIKAASDCRPDDDMRLYRDMDWNYSWHGHGRGGTH